MCIVVFVLFLVYRMLFDRFNPISRDFINRSTHFQIVIHSVVRENCIRLIKDLKYNTWKKNCTTEFQILILPFYRVIYWNTDCLLGIVFLLCVGRTLAPLQYLHLCDLVYPVYVNDRHISYATILKTFQAIKNSPVN